MNVDELSFMVNMSPLAFHRAIKGVTAFSLIQCIKKIQLNRVRELMLDRNLRVQEAAMQVGYESPTQIGCEFKRYYGSGPSKHVRR